MDSVAITDHGNMYGVIEFYQECKKHGVRPIVGCEVYIAAGSMEDKSKDNSTHHLILLAKNTRGYENLMKLVSLANLKGFYRKPRIDFDLLKKYSDGLVCLSGCLSGEVSSALKEDNYLAAKAMALKYHAVFGDDYYIEIQRHINNADQNKVTPMLVRLARELNIPMVATGDCHYLHKEDSAYHDVLLAIQTGRSVDDPDRMTMNGDDFSVASPEAMLELFSDIPEAVYNTQLVAEKCNLEIEFGKIHLPEYETEDPNQELERLASVGCQKKNLGPDYEERLQYELDVIAKTGFATYLLIVQDLINWAKDNNIAVGPGRGSAAGSLLCYVLGITTVDPLKYGLLFERFMNPDRVSMPDIDIDIDEEKRAEVLDYVKGKYGGDSVAQIITFGTMAARASIRDVGRALRLPIPLCDQIAKLVPPTMGLAESLEKVPQLSHEYNRDPEVKRLIDIACHLEGVVRHAGTHACGVVIAKNKINKYTPTQNSTRDEHTVTTQYDMYSVDALGLLKIDFLGLRNLTIIRKTLEYIEQRYGTKLSIDAIPLNNKRTFKLLQDAKTTSVFQLESDGMKRHLRQLKPTSIDDITAMISLYRPGPMELIPEYIARKHGKHKVSYLHPSLEPILKDTYGIMIYQEQLMAAVRALAGLTLAQADILRKAVGKKDANLLHEQETVFMAGAKRIGTPEEVAKTFWALVEPFSRYGFNKSHAVAYAMTGYSTAYLKANYPVEFMTAVMNCDSTDVARISELIREIKILGINIAGPDVNLGSTGFSIDRGLVRFGMSGIKGVGEEVMNKIVKARQAGDKFTTVADIILRLDDKAVNKRLVELLAKSGSLDSLTEREGAVMASDQIIAYNKINNKNLLPNMQLPVIPKDLRSRLIWEKELLGFFLSENPADRYEDKIRKHKAIELANVKSYPSDFITVGGLLSDVKKVLTRKGTTMVTASLQDKTGRVDIVVFQKAYDKLEPILKNNNVVVINGRIDTSVGAKIICSRGIKVDSLEQIVL